MLKVCTEEDGNKLANKAKRFLIRLTSGVVAFIILATGSGAMSKAKATSGVDNEGDEFGFVDINGVYQPDAEAPEAYRGEAETVVVDANPEEVASDLGTAEMKGTLQERLFAGFTWLRVAAQTVAEMATEESIVEEVVPEVVEPVLEDTAVGDTSDFSSIASKLASPYECEPEGVIEAEVVSETEDETEDVIIEEDETIRCLREVETPEEVEDTYTGVAPKDYIGLDHTILNYGDASNDEEVRERAEIVYNHLHAMNQRYGGLVIFNPYTSKEYTVEELMDIIKFMNGAYVAKDGADAKYINDLWIEFIVSILNDKYLIEDVNYKAYSDVITEDEVTEHENVLENLDLSILLMGDSYTQPFMKWFAGRINAMFKTTSREETIAIYNEVYLAITAIVEGNGFVIDGVNYTITDFSKVNDMLLILEVLVSQEMRNDRMEIGYVFDKENVGEDFVFLTDVLLQFNPVCADDLADTLRNEGVEVIEGVVEHGDGTNLDIRNYASVMQMNAFSMALSNGEYGIDYYRNRYLNESEPAMVLTKSK